MSSAEPSTTEPAAPAEPTAPVVSNVPISTPATPAVSANWRDSLPVDIRENPTLSSIESVDALALEHINVQKLIGAEKIALPQEDWDESQINDFHTKMGRPALAEDYDLSSVTVPEDFQIDEGFQGRMIAKLHSLGAPQALVAGIIQAVYEDQAEQIQGMNSDIRISNETGIKDLRTEWGKSFDSQVDLATRAFRQATGEDFESVAGILLADGSKLGDRPEIIRAFASIGGRMNEHGLVGGKTSNSTLSPSQAGGERNKLMVDPEFLSAYLDGTHLEHDAAVQRISDLTDAEVVNDSR